ncbi:hypothetical protein [Mycobacterium sp. ZZG]
MIEELLKVDVDEEKFPVTAAMQGYVTTALTDYPTPEEAGDSALVATLALAVLQLENALVDTRKELLDARADALASKAAVINLERRLIEAGYQFAPREDAD